MAPANRIANFYRRPSQVDGFRPIDRGIAAYFATPEATPTVERRQDARRLSRRTPDLSEGRRLRGPLTTFVGASLLTALGLTALVGGVAVGAGCVPSPGFAVTLAIGGGIVAGVGILVAYGAMVFIAAASCGVERRGTQRA